MIWQAGLIWLLLAGVGGAVELSLPPSARQTAERNTGPDSYTAPISVFEDGSIDTVTVEGDVARAAWRLKVPGMTPLQLVRPLRSQLEAAGYSIALECSAAVCGGFDFRFAVETLPGPNMYVNIRAYQFLTATLGPLKAPTRVVSVLASTSTSSAYVQIIQAVQTIGQVGVTQDPESAAVTMTSPTGGGLKDTLLDQGHVVLSGLDFSTGNSGLGAAGVASLEGLAGFLRDNPGLRIALVGHTDSVGGLAPNIALSRDRAAAVRRRLIDDYDIDPGRIDAEGMGYLAPVASNLTEAGRDANRRVEAILLSPPQAD